MTGVNGADSESSKRRLRGRPVFGGGGAGEGPMLFKSGVDLIFSPQQRRHARPSQWPIDYPGSPSGMAPITVDGTGVPSQARR